MWEILRVIAQADLDLIGLNRVVTEPSISSFVAPASTNGYTATWTFAAAFPAAQYLLVLSGDIEDLTGNALDGEWTNPGTILSSVTTSVFPSGNGVAGGDFEFVFTMNFADVNRDGDVDITDKNIQSSHFFGTGKTFTQGDGNGDGAVTIVDSNSLNAVFFDNSYNMRNLTILGDYDDDFELDANDETDFLGFYTTSNSADDLNGDSHVNQADYDAFCELLNFGVDLDVLT